MANIPLNTALDILAERLFDYSGMFPPESKSLEDTLSESAHFGMTLTRPFLLNAGIVLTIKDLSSLSDETLSRSNFVEETVLSIALLGSELRQDDVTLRAELELIERYNVEGAESSVKKQIISYEIKIGDGSASLKAIIERNHPLMTRIGVPISFEPDLSGDNWQETLRDTIDLISLDPVLFGLKIRGTGPTAIGNEKIAFVIAAVCDAKIHLKATGGLHHPLLEEQYGNNLGFLGLTAALFLRHAIGENFSIDAIMGCLCASEPSALELETQLGWNDHLIPLEALRTVRSKYRFSIGSCSIKEPDEDLVRLFG